MVCVYRKKHYAIYSNQEGFIIHNTNKEFSIGHTHINNYNTAKYLVNLAYYKRLPNRKCDYFIESLIRITDDNAYKRLLNNNLKTKKAPKNHRTNF